MKRLDSRHKRSRKAGNFTAKVKVASTPSLEPAPVSPNWAVRASFRPPTPPPPTPALPPQTRDHSNSNSSASGSESSESESD